MSFLIDLYKLICLFTLLKLIFIQYKKVDELATNIFISSIDLSITGKVF